MGGPDPAPRTSLSLLLFPAAMAHDLAQAILGELQRLWDEEPHEEPQPFTALLLLHGVDEHPLNRPPRPCPPTQVCTWAAGILYSG